MAATPGRGSGVKALQVTKIVPFICRVYVVDKKHIKDIILINSKVVNYFIIMQSWIELLFSSSIKYFFLE